MTSWVYEPSSEPRTPLGRVARMIRLWLVTVPMLIVWLSAAAIHDTGAWLRRGLRDHVAAEGEVRRARLGFKASEIRGGTGVPVGQHCGTTVDRGGP
jgi:hypothetical protein